MSSNSIREQIEEKLSILEGERVRLLRRAALMLSLDFGDDIKIMVKTGADQEKEIIAPQYSLHIHSSWRLLKNGEICVGHSDLFNRMLGGFKAYEDDMTDHDYFSECAADINEDIKNRELKVIKIEANELGDLKIHMDDNYCLELFVDTFGNEESWRFIEANEAESFVVFD